MPFSWYWPPSFETEIAILGAIMAKDLFILLYHGKE